MPGELGVGRHWADDQRTGGAPLPARRAVPDAGAAAALPEARARAVLDAMPVRAFTPATRTDKEAVWAEVQEARRGGYAVGRMEYLEGVMSIAVAIPDEDGAVRLVLQCTGGHSLPGSLRKAPAPLPGPGAGLPTGSGRPFDVAAWRGAPASAVPAGAVECRKINAVLRPGSRAVATSTARAPRAGH
ncbi:IclR family transcriptional regulator domain-containing protein [Roseomonas sp. WA12]